MTDSSANVTLTIHSLSEKGDGLADWQGKKIYIPDALPNEVAEVSLSGIKPKYAQGQIKKCIQPSPDRVVSHCEYQKCGGCQIPHMSYAAQLKIKQTIVQTSLSKYGISTPVQPCLGMEHPFSFRNKAIFSVKNTEQGVALGFYEKNSHKLIDIEHCPVQHNDVSQIIRIIREWMNEFSIQGYDELSHRGWLRQVLIRHGFATNEVMLVLVTLSDDFPYQKELLKRLEQEIELDSVVQNINSERGNRILGDKNQCIKGKSSIDDLLLDMTFSISPHSFYQVNPKQTDVLYASALKMAELTGIETVFDVYCGIGTISLYLAETAKKVVGIEIVPQAIDDAKSNAFRNGFDNAEFFVGKAEEVVPQLYHQGYQADVVVVDPPRKGCDRLVLDTMLKMNPDRIVYVSCDPDSLARDLAYLGSEQYELTQVQPVDMFPHSMHVETVVQLKKRKV